jgi:two-component system response regulator FixJ
MAEEIVYVVDDDDDVRDSLRLLLELNGFRVVSSPSAAAHLEQMDPAAAACTIVDLRMPGATGLELQRTLAERGVPHPIVFITGHGDVASAVEAMKAGAADFLEKPFPESALLAAVRAALARERERVARRGESAAAHARLARLTPREREVGALVAAGLTTKEIAQRLAISVRTIDVYRANLLVKTGARNSVELARVLDAFE